MRKLVCMSSFLFALVGVWSVFPTHLQASPSDRGAHISAIKNVKDILPLVQGSNLVAEIKVDGHYTIFMGVPRDQLMTEFVSLFSGTEFIRVPSSGEFRQNLVSHGKNSENIKLSLVRVHSGGSHSTEFGEWETWNFELTTLDGKKYVQIDGYYEPEGFKLLLPLDASKEAAYHQLLAKYAQTKHLLPGSLDSLPDMKRIRPEEFAHLYNQGTDCVVAAPGVTKKQGQPASLPGRNCFDTILKNMSSIRITRDRYSLFVLDRAKSELTSLYSGVRQPTYTSKGVDLQKKCTAGLTTRTFWLFEGKDKKHKKFVLFLDTRCSTQTALDKSRTVIGRSFGHVEPAIVAGGWADLDVEIIDVTSAITRLRASKH